MSEFLAEARILVRPDTARFRVDLEKQLQSVLARPVRIPVIPVVAPSAFAGAVAGTTAFAAAQSATTAATTATADALAAATTISRQYAGAVDLAAVSTKALATAQTEEVAAATAASAAQARATGNATKGIIAQSASLLGLRAGTLAASTAFIGGTVAVLAFSKAVKSAASLQTELNVFKVTAGATADEMQRVAEEAKQLGRDLTLPGVTASDAAQAMTELAKAGLSVQDSLAGARGVLQLSTAAQIDVANSTKIVAGALNAFGLAGTDAVRVADLLAGAAKSAQGEISDFGPALGQAAAVAHTFGVSIQDTITLLTELAQAGIQGGRAGTSLRVAFLRLVNPPADAAKALKELNVQIRDANGNLRPQVFTDIATAMEGYTKAQRDATLATIFGSDAIRTAAIIGAKGADSFNQTRAAVTEMGLAQQQAAARTAGLQGDISNLQNQVDSLGLTIGQVSTGPLSVFVKSLADTVSEMGLAADGAVVLASKIKKIEESFPGGDKLDKFRGVLKKLAEASNPAALELKLAAEAARAFGIDSEKSGKKAKVFGDIADAVTKSIVGLNAALKGGAADVKANQPKFQEFNVQKILNQVQGFDDQQVKDKIAGDNAKLLADLQAEQTFLVAELQKQGVKNRPALQRALNDALLGVVTDIRGIQARAKAANDALKAEAKRNAEETARSVEGAAKTVASGVARAAAIIRAAAKKNKVTVDKGGSFTLADLFRSATENFNTFGSNIAGRNGVLSAQDARGSLGGSILAQLGTAQLTEAQKQTALLQSINGKIGTTGNQGGSGSGLNNWQMYRQSLTAAAGGYGRF